MSTDYKIACFDCKSVGPIFASGSGSYGYKVWAATDTWGESDVQKWLGHSTVGVTQRYIRRTAQPLVKKAAELGFMAGSLSVQRQSKKVVKLKQRGGK